MLQRSAVPHWRPSPGGCRLAEFQDRLVGHREGKRFTVPPWMGNRQGVLFFPLSSVAPAVTRRPRSTAQMQGNRTPTSFASNG